MRKILITLLLFIPSIALANSISNINMDIYVDNNGTAHVTEEWNASLNSGTEGYKPYYNLGQSEIKNFKVKMNGKDYSYYDDWNVNGSFNEKKYKNGFNYVDNGIELCFGISEYGNNKYTLTYDITNFVVKTSDGYQMIYWTLFPYDYNPNPGRVYIKIHSDFKYSDSLDVWGYGKYGAPCYVYDGYIEMDSEGRVDSDEYMTILVKFPENTFNTSVTLDDTFDSYLEMADAGAVNYSDKKSFFEKIITFFEVLSGLIPFIVFAIIGIFVAKNSVKYGTYKLNFGETKNKINTKELNYFRDIPYKKENIARGYWIACQYNQVKKSTDYLGAILLKWLKQGNVTLEKVSKDKLIGKTKEETNIIFNTCENLDANETELYNMMYIASVDGKLEKNEFTSWCNTNYSKILNWFNKVIDSETLKLANENILTREKYNKYIVSPSMMDEAKKVAGLKKFLNEFSNIKDRNAIEVNLWDEYLMYAMIFGIADKVMKEFKDLYPDVITDEIYDNITFVHYVSYTGINSATTAKSRAESYSGGGGGFSSGGGGGGSFGGGGGGGGFR